MKLIKSTLLLAVAAIMAVSCQEGLRVNDVDGHQNTGYLSLSALSVEVVSDHKPVDGELSRAEATRADVDIDRIIRLRGGGLVVPVFWHWLG